MPELRKDPIVSRWVIISTERAKRPSDFSSDKPASSNGKENCPFCSGNESKTPEEILAYRQTGSNPNTEGWWIRVIPNKFAALNMEEEVSKSWVGMFDMMSGFGTHEVIIETPDHDRSIPDLSNHQITKIIWAYRDRILHLKRDPKIKYVLIFKNHGEAAGASLSHSHSQLIALPIIPKRVHEELQGFIKYYEYKERCVFCDMIKQELISGTRIILENNYFTSFNPFASRFPFETWIVPRRHEGDFTNISKEEISDLADILKHTLYKIKKVLNDPPFNFILHTTPTQRILGDYHWHIEIMPRITKIAGFEWGSGFYINPIPPEEACKFLREIKE